jgi:hypothetical protein
VPNSTQPSVNPWKGLHFYTEDDQGVFFGREKEVLDLLRFLNRDCLTILFARSGMGKTSLLRAGLIPQLRKDDCLPVIVRIIPGEEAESPSQQIIQALQQAASENKVDIEALAESAGSVPETLWEYFHRYRFWGKRNDPIRPVVILDQFEELFTLGHGSPRTTAFLEELADLVENRMPSRLEQYLEVHEQRLSFDPRFHDFKILLSLREDFVPFLDRLQPSMPAVMRNRYCLEPLLWPAAVDIVKRAGGLYVIPEVAEMIATAVTAARTDFDPHTNDVPVATSEVEPAYLSVMCHELFRRMLEKNEQQINAQLVSEESGSILSNLYNRSFENLPSGVRTFVEDRLLSDSGYRLTLPLAEADKAGVSRSELEKLVKLRLLRFEYRLGTTHVELSHDLLREIVQDSRLNRQQQLEEAEHRQQEEAINLKLRQSRRMAKIGLFTSGGLLSGIMLYLFGTQFDSTAYTTQFTTKWGEPIPVGKLPWLAHHSRNSTFRITRKGWWGNVKTLEIVNSQNQPTEDQEFNVITQSALPNTRDPMPKSESKGQFSSKEYSYDNNRYIVYEIVRDRSDRIVSGFAYLPIKQQPRSSKFHMSGKVQAFFLGPGGQPRSYPQTNAESIEITRNKKGFDVMNIYKDVNNMPTLGPDNVFGKKMDYSSGRLVNVTYLAENGSPMLDANGKAGEEYEYDSSGNIVGIRAFDVSGLPTNTNSGYYRKKLIYDTFGRVKEIQFFGYTDSAEEPVRENELNAHIVKIEKFDQHGNPLLIRYPDEKKLPRTALLGAYPSNSAYQVSLEYNDQNKPIKILYKVKSPDSRDPGQWNEIRYRYDSNTGRVVSQSLFSNTEGKEKRVDDSSWGPHMSVNTYDKFGHIIEQRYFGSQNLKPAKVRIGQYHLLKIKYDEFGNAI